MRELTSHIEVIGSDSSQDSSEYLHFSKHITSFAFTLSLHKGSPVSQWLSQSLGPDLVRSIVLLTTMQGGDRSLRNWLHRQKPPSRGRTIPPPSQASVTGFTGPTLLAKFLKNVIIKMKTRPARSNHWKSTALHSSLFLRNAVLASWKIRKSDLKFHRSLLEESKQKFLFFHFMF